MDKPILPKISGPFFATFMVFMRALCSDPLIAFTDGACSGNPGPGGWAAVLIWPREQILEIGGGEKTTTNNRMEMAAAIAVLKAARDFSGPVRIHSDSTYVISGITSWISGWKRKGWKTAAGDPVANRDLWEILEDLCSRRGKTGMEWRHVRGHSGIAGNERCDELAVAFSQGEYPALYAGPLRDYAIDILRGIQESRA
ncbi:MAG: ribonuclease HI [Elusimicrobiota bacterium]